MLVKSRKKRHDFKKTKFAKTPMGKNAQTLKKTKSNKMPRGAKTANSAKTP